MKETLFIINPKSARGATLGAWQGAWREIMSHAIEFTEHQTSRAGEATEVTRDALRSGTARVIAVGGDGTLSEVVNGYIEEDGRAINDSAAIGLLPSGTGSDFSRSLGWDSPGDAIHAIVKSKTRRLDAVRAIFTSKDKASLSRTFINLASFGMGGNVSAFVNQWRDTLPKWISGRARFIAASVRALEMYKNIPTNLKLDGERELQISSDLIIAANGRFAGGGMMLAPNAEMDDGLLDLIITDRASRLDVIRELPRIQRGGYLKNPKVSELRVKEFSITSDEPMAIDIDGEMAGYTPAHLKVLPSAVRFLS